MEEESLVSWVLLSSHRPSLTREVGSISVEDGRLYRPSSLWSTSRSRREWRRSSITSLEPSCPRATRTPSGSSEGPISHLYRLHRRTRLSCITRLGFDMYFTHRTIFRHLQPSYMPLPAPSPVPAVRPSCSSAHAMSFRWTLVSLVSQLCCSFPSEASCEVAWVRIDASWFVPHPKTPSPLLPIPPGSGNFFAVYSLY